jgi:hypothetical protein
VVLLGAGSTCPPGSSGSVVVGCSLSGVPLVNCVFLGGGERSLEGTASGTVCLGAPPASVEPDTVYVMSGEREVLRSGPDVQRLFDGALRRSPEGIGVTGRLSLDMRPALQASGADANPAQALDFLGSFVTAGSPSSGYGLSGVESGDVASFVGALTCAVVGMADRIAQLESLLRKPESPAS